jgi:hypothetical protein
MAFPRARLDRSGQFECKRGSSPQRAARRSCGDPTPATPAELRRGLLDPVTDRRRPPPAPRRASLTARGRRYHVARGIPASSQNRLTLRPPLSGSPPAPRDETRRPATPEGPQLDVRHTERLRQLSDVILELLFPPRQDGPRPVPEQELLVSALRFAAVGGCTPPPRVDDAAALESSARCFRRVSSRAAPAV